MLYKKIKAHIVPSLITYNSMTLNDYKITVAVTRLLNKSYGWLTETAGRNQFGWTIPNQKTRIHSCEEGQLFVSKNGDQSDVSGIRTVNESE